MADPKIRYDIEAAVSGEKGAQELAQTMRELGDVLDGDLQQSAQTAARELQALSDKAAAAAEFGVLKRESVDLAKSLAGATTVVERLGAELPEAASKTQALASAEQAAAAALKAAQAEATAKREALKKLREETTGAARKSDEFKTTQAGLAAAIKQGTAEIKTRSAELKGAAQQTQQARSAEQALTVEYDKAVRSAGRLSQELGSKNSALAASRQALQAMGVGTDNLALAQRNLQGAVAQVRERVQAMVPAYQQAASASAASTQAQAQHQRTLREGLTSIGGQLQRVQQLATVALGGSYVGGMARSLAQTADEAKNLQARLQIVTGEGPALQQAWEGVTRVALQTNSALAETGTLFTRLHKTALEGGASAAQAQEQALALTQTINQAVQLSGGTADSARAAITQLIQGLQSGVLRGEEFNSVMEQAPRLAQALANGLGRTTGELRAMAQAGQLSAEVVTGALRGQAAVVEAEFSKLPPTVGRALQNLSTQWTLYVAESDRGLISSASAAKVLNALAENLDLVVGGLTAAGKVWAATRIAALAADFGVWVQKTLAATTALQANTAATGANAAAQAGLAAAQARVAGAQAASTAATVANTAARGANAAAWASVASFAGQAARATESATAAVAGQTRAMGLFGRAAGALTGVLGGPVGLLVTAVTFAGEIKRGIVGITEWAAGFTAAGRQLKAFEQQQAQAIETEKQGTVQRKKAAEAALAQAQSAKAAHDAQLGLTKQTVAVVDGFEALIKKGERVDDALSQIGRDFDLSRVAGIADAGAVLDALVLKGQISAGQMRKALGGALQGLDLGTFKTQAMTAFGAGEQGARRLQAALDAVRDESLRRLGTSVDELRSGFSRTFTSAVNDLDEAAAALRALGADAATTGRLLGQALDKVAAAADTDKAVQALIERLKALHAQGRISGEQLAKGLADARRKLDELRPGIDGLAEAYRHFGLKTRAELQAVADRNRAAWEQIRRDATASIEVKRQAFTQYAQSAIAANGGVADSSVKLQAAVLKVAVEVDKTGRATVRSMDEAGAAVEKTTRLFNDLGREVNKYGQEINQLAASIGAAMDGVRSGADRGKALAPGIKSDFGADAYGGDGHRLSGGYAGQYTPPDDSGSWEFDVQAWQQAGGAGGAMDDNAAKRFWRRKPGWVGSKDPNVGVFGGYAGSANQRAGIPDPSVHVRRPAAAQPAGQVVTVNLSVNGGAPVPVTTSGREADRLLRELELAKGTGA